jgi:phosphoglycolate phosphatase
MAKKQFDFIVFDWDGTLMDSTATIVKCIQAAAKDLGLPIPGDHSAAYVIGLSLLEAMKAVFPMLIRNTIRAWWSVIVSTIC